MPALAVVLAVEAELGDGDRRAYRGPLPREDVGGPQVAQVGAGERQRGSRDVDGEAGLKPSASSRTRSVSVDAIDQERIQRLAEQEERAVDWRGRDVAGVHPRHPARTEATGEGEGHVLPHTAVAVVGVVELHGAEQVGIAADMSAWRAPMRAARAIVVGSWLHCGSVASRRCT